MSFHNFLNKFSKKKKKPEIDLKQDLQRTMEQQGQTSVENSFSYYTTQNTQESCLSDESDISTMSEVDPGSARFANLMGVINNPEINAKENVLENFKGIFSGISRRVWKKKNKKLLRVANKVSRSIHDDAFKEYKDKVNKVNSRLKEDHDQNGQKERRRENGKSQQRSFNGKK